MFVVRCGGMFDPQGRTLDIVTVQKGRPFCTVTVMSPDAVNPASAKTYNPTKVQSSNTLATSQYSAQSARHRKSDYGSLCALELA
jgi:hypothetical protein